MGHTAASPDAAHGHHDGEFAHPASIRMLLTVFFVLVGLTFLTVYQASFDLGGAEIWLSLIIATIKASLVILFFMHLLYDKPFNAILFISSLIFVTLFLGFTLLDAKAYRNQIEVRDTLEESMKPVPKQPDVEPTRIGATMM